MGKWRQGLLSTHQMTGFPPKAAVTTADHLRVFRRRLRETNPTPMRRTGLPVRANASARRTENLQSGREPGAFGSGAGEIVKLQFHKNLGDRSRRLLLGKISHQFLEEFLQSFFALLQRGQIDTKRFLRTERFAWAVRFDRSIIDPAAEIVEFNAKFTEKIDKIGTREAL